MRQTWIATLLPGLVEPTMRGRSEDSFTVLPSNLRMTSPISMPALSAAAPFSTEATSAPCALLRLKDSASSLLTSWMPMPSRPRLTLPLALSWPWMSIARSIGMAKDSPIEPPERE